ncbi:MAG: GTPase Era [Anaerolineaceae bacterium]|nr:MAG: GTPase Era [Anaerolineaceae bacterium]
MESSDTQGGHRSGFVALAGRPNIGKSTLINAFLGQNIAAVSPRPQTTRFRQLGILTLPNAQVIFVDTPGIHKPLHKLGEQMNADALEVLEDADLILVMFDISQLPTEDDERVAERVQQLSSKPPMLVVLNKVDLIPPDEILEHQSDFETLLPDTEIHVISSTRGDGRDVLLDRILELLPFGPQYYAEDIITDAYERDIAADLLRAAALNLLRDEVPHCIAIRIDEYKERNEHGAYIEATIFVERNSQKGIVIGKGGAMLREIGTLARKEIEAMSGRKVYLKLRVKVLPKWRNDMNALRRLGFVHTKRKS